MVFNVPKYDNKRPERKIIIKKVGIIDLDGLYQTMYRWFYDQKYYFEEGTSRLRPGSPAGVQYEYRWTAWRKVNDYVKFNISTWIYVYDAKELEVIKEGKKIKLTKCRLQIELDGSVEMDYTGRFSKTKFGQFLFWFYNSFILQEEKFVANWWDELYYRMYKLQTIIKEYIDMEAKGNAYYDIW